MRSTDRLNYELMEMMLLARMNTMMESRMGRIEVCWTKRKEKCPEGRTMHLADRKRRINSDVMDSR
jgi:hypothetical protein